MASNFLKSKLHCKNVPWCEDDPDLLGQNIMEFIYDSESYIRRWAQRWFENFQFIYGNSSVRWSKKYDFAVDVDFLSRDRGTSQKASTNISAEVAEALAAFVYSSVPGFDAVTAENSSLKGKRFSKICQKLLDAYMQRLCMDQEFRAAAMIFVTFSQVAARVDFDHTAGSQLEIPQWKKIKAPVYTDYMAPNAVTGGLLEIPTAALGGDGQPYFQERWEPVLDQNGRQVISKMNTGDVKVTMLTPFEYRRQIGSYASHRSRYWQHIKLEDYDKVIAELEHIDGKTKHFNDIAPIMNDQMMYSFAVRHFMRLQFTTPPTLEEGFGFKRAEQVLKGSIFKNKVLVIDHFDEPNKEVWPEGRRVITVNGKATHITRPQYYTNKIDGWHPFVEAQWMSVPPSSISRGPMDSTTAKNRELNVADSLIATAMRRNMGSQLLIRMNSGLDPLKISGEPGQQHMVNDPATAARYLHDDMPIPPAIPTIRQSIKDDVYSVSGAMDAIRGERSKNMSAGYAIKLQQEREEKRITPARKEFERLGSGIGEKALICLKQNVKKLDDDIMGRLKRSGAGEFQTQDVVAFLTAPMDFGIDVNVVPGSMVAKSMASQQATYMDLLKGPAAMRVQQNPAVLDKVLKLFEAEELRDESSAHRDRADRENETFSDLMRLGANSEGIKIPVVLFEDDDKIHMMQHADFMIRNSEEIMTSEFHLRSIIMHMEQHRIQDAEKQGQLAPGTSVNLPQQYQQVSAQPPPPVPMLAQQNQQMKMQQAQQPPQQPAQSAPQNSGGTLKPPQAPKEPKPAPGGGKVISTSAPSQNTPTAGTPGGQF